MTYMARVPSSRTSISRVSSAFLRSFSTDSALAAMEAYFFDGNCTFT